MIFLFWADFPDVLPNTSMLRPKFRIVGYGVLAYNYGGQMNYAQYGGTYGNRNDEQRRKVPFR